MNVASIKQAFMAGVVGTVVMTVFTFISRYLQLPSSDFHEMLATHFKMGTASAWIVYFALGVVLAYLYGTFFRAVLPAHSWSRGMIYALILWVVAEIVLMPMAGMGFFAGSMGVATVTFVGMALFGATVGYLYEH